MRMPAAWVAMLVLVAVGGASCSSNSDATSVALASQVDSLEEELADARRALTDQQPALDEVLAEIERQEAALEAQTAIDNTNKAALAEAARRTRELLADAALREKDVASLRNLACTSVERDLPASIQDAFVPWLIETESAAGDIPSDLMVTFVEAAGRDGDWVFFADFATRFEPAVFSVDSDRNFNGLWGGMAPSESGIWDYLAETYPAGDAALAACLDLSFFVE